MSQDSEKKKFDKLAFVKYMKNIGRAYRKQATELVSVCRTLVQAQTQTPQWDAKLRTALDAVDDALSTAADVKTKGSKKVDEKFERAIELLSRYESECHPRIPASGKCQVITVHERMAAAKSKDKSSSAIMNVIKEKLSLKAAEDEQQEPTTIVEFLLLNSLTDKAPTIVKQVLSDKSSLHEILWNFSRFKGERRLTLKENPHFYNPLDLPTSPESYVGDFRTDPIDSFMHSKICVIKDKPGRVFLETDQKTRAFGNVWVPNDAIILKDVCGKLEGESIVQSSIPGSPDSWYFEESLLSPTSPQGVSPNQSTPSPSMTSSPTGSVAEGRFQDWREPIRKGLIPSDIDIRIWALPAPSIVDPSTPAPLSPTPAGSSGGDGGPLSTLQIPSDTSLRRTHRKARPTVSPQQSPLRMSSARCPPHSSLTSPSVPNPQQPSIVAPPSTNRATPISKLARPVAPTSCDASRSEEHQDNALSRELSIPKIDENVAVPSLPLMNVTDTSPSGTTRPYMPHVEGGEAKGCGKERHQANAHDSAQQNGASRLNPCQDVTPTPPPGGGNEHYRTELSQADTYGSVQRKNAAIPPYPGTKPVQLQEQGSVGHTTWSWGLQLWSRLWQSGS